MNVRSLMRQEQGMAMLVVIALAALVSVLGLTLLETVRSESTRSSHAVWSEESYHAAEAGLDDYIAKVIDDHVYYQHQVHPGESTRSAAGPGCTNVPGGSAWPAACGLTWTYPNGKDKWRGSSGTVQLGNGYEYNLQITAPSAGSRSVRIVATGRKVGATADVRAVEALIRPSSIAEFQMLANDDINYGSTATTTGKIYAGKDSSGVKHGVGHAGTARANVYAEGCVGTWVDANNQTCSGSGPNLQNGAQKYDQSTIRTVIKNPVDFGSFLTSLTDIERAAALVNTKFDDASAAAWRVILQADGTFTLAKCTLGAGVVAQYSPSCGATTTYAIPSNGAVYFAQTAIVSGTVDGRLTIASYQDVVVGGDITYEDVNDDVLGLNARGNVYVANWVPGYNLTWRAATIAQSGTWQSGLCIWPRTISAATNASPIVITASNHGLINGGTAHISGVLGNTAANGNWTVTVIDSNRFRLNGSAGNGSYSSGGAVSPKDTMTFTGSTATNGGGCMTLFATRNYDYDPNLYWLAPPWFPTVEDVYTVQLFRELKAN